MVGPMRDPISHRDSNRGERWEEEGPAPPAGPTGLTRPHRGRPHSTARDCTLLQSRTVQSRTARDCTDLSARTPRRSDRTARRRAGCSTATHQANVIATAHVTLRRSDRCYRNGVIATDQTDFIVTAYVTLHRSDRTGCDGTDLTAHHRNRHGEIGLTGGTDSDRGRNRVC